MRRETTKETEMAELNTVAVGDRAASVCCGGPAAQEANACCVKDAGAKASGETGCGCGVPNAAQKSAPTVTGSCCEPAR